MTFNDGAIDTVPSSNNNSPGENEWFMSTDLFRPGDRGVSPPPSTMPSSESFIATSVLANKPDPSASKALTMSAGLLLRTSRYLDGFTSEYDSVVPTQAALQNASDRFDHDVSDDIKAVASVLPVIADSMERKASRGKEYDPTWWSMNPFSKSSRADSDALTDLSVVEHTAYENLEQKYAKYADSSDPEALKRQYGGKNGSEIATFPTTAPSRQSQSTPNSRDRTILRGPLGGEGPGRSSRQSQASERDAGTARWTAVRPRFSGISEALTQTASELASISVGRSDPTTTNQSASKLHQMSKRLPGLGLMVIARGHLLHYASEDDQQQTQADIRVREGAEPSQGEASGLGTSRQAFIASDSYTKDVGYITDCQEDAQGSAFEFSEWDHRPAVLEHIKWTEWESSKSELGTGKR